MKRRVVFASLLSLAMAASLTPAQAQEYTFFEVYGGYYDPGLDTLDNDITGGLRFGGRFNENFGAELAAGFFDLNGDANRPLEGAVGDANAYLVDGSVVWYVAGSNFGLLGGIGFATVDVTVLTRPGIDGEERSDDAFTYHFGANYEWDIGETFYVKPEVRVRKFEGDTYEKSDTEYSIGLGWKL